MSNRRKGNVSTWIRRCKLFRFQRGKCYWCKRPMLLSKWYRAGRQPPNFCTLDHLDDKLSGERGKHNGEYRTVVACRECNEGRAAEKLKALPIEELWERSKRRPREQQISP